jgi:hypothetical protein
MVNFVDEMIERSSFDSMHLGGGILRVRTSSHTGAFRYRIACVLEQGQVIPQSQDRCSSRHLTYDIWLSNSLSAKVCKCSKGDGYSCRTPKPVSRYVS